MLKLQPAMRKLFSKESNQKAQSAMEYLMTYGWAILIIAVVLGALFRLGVFNANNFAPKAPPGACQIFRPNGPGTTSFINLEGVCSGELPEYVTQFKSQGWINLGNNPMLEFKTFTVTAWVYQISYYGSSPWQDIATSYGNSWIFRAVEGSGNGKLETLINVGGTWYGSGYSSCGTSGGALPLNKWVFVAMTYNGFAVSAYSNGALNGTPCSISGMTPITYSTAIGSTSGGGEIFNGSIANVQIYNTSLSASEIQALYLEGIGGAPIQLQNLVGWWPLNGNANDYSGNGNNGVPTAAVSFVSNWWNGYTPP